MNFSTILRELVLIYLVGLLAYLYYHKHCKLEIAYINPNFDCYTRMGGIEKSARLIKREQRRVAFGQLVVVAFDVAGMGTLNSLIGEEAVNTSMKSALADVRKWRGVWFTSQVNSGDEFSLIVDVADAPGIRRKLNTTFKAHGFVGAYTGVALLDNGYEAAMVKAMKKVYAEKSRLKQA